MAARRACNSICRFAGGWLRELQRHVYCIVPVYGHGAMPMPAPHGRARAESYQ